MRHCTRSQGPLPLCPIARRRTEGSNALLPRGHTAAAKSRAVRAAGELGDRCNLQWRQGEGAG